MRTIQSIRRAFCVVAFSLLTISLANLGFAEGKTAVVSTYPETPHATIELVSTELLGGLQDLLVVYDESVEDFYAGIDAIVSPWIDFDAFYKGVMGRKYYTDASPEQRARFKEVFHKSLIETYGKGLLGIEETRFEVTPPKQSNDSTSDKKRKSVPVEQVLFSGSGRVVVVYTMGQAEDGRWRLKNVILEGINLGKTFRNQFARSAREHSGDINLVIENWSSGG